MILQGLQLILIIDNLSTYLYLCFAVSLSKVGPAVSKLWCSAKTAIANTQAKRLVHNPIVDKAEGAVYKLTDMMINLITKLRDSQLPNELKYLEKEIAKIKRRLEEKNK